jgi:hypothetical protein
MMNFDTPFELWGKTEAVREKNKFFANEFSKRPLCHHRDHSISSAPGIESVAFSRRPAGRNRSRRLILGLSERISIDQPSADSGPVGSGSHIDNVVIQHPLGQLPDDVISSGDRHKLTGTPSIRAVVPPIKAVQFD